MYNIYLKFYLENECSSGKTVHKTGLHVFLVNNTVLSRKVNLIRHQRYTISSTEMTVSLGAAKGHTQTSITAKCRRSQDEALTSPTLLTCAGLANEAGIIIRPRSYSDYYRTCGNQNQNQRYIIGKFQHLSSRTNLPRNQYRIYAGE